ncbi:glutathione S-transferase T3-like [Panicum hallii]|uniref:glutathione S-transferase T3-like n=1 Tax=Panicum hallii TaxID=206008 RepID=UPI000DF4D45B|nr:glutathione S-transferase T3-like [Panicum hallii]
MSPGFYTNLLNQSSKDVFLFQEIMESEHEVIESPPSNDSGSQSKPKGRSKNFSEAEDILLVSEYLNISKDAIIGRDQKDGRYWERIDKYFHVNRTFESDRNWSSLKHRWGIIHKDVSIFQGFHENIERRNESGKTSDDKVAEANAVLHELRKKAFPFFHAWNILRQEPEWAEDKASHEPNNAYVDDHPNAQRPAGRKAEKEKLKEKRRSDDEPDPFIEEVKK